MSTAKGPFPVAKPPPAQRVARRTLTVVAPATPRATTTTTLAGPEARVPVGARARGRARTAPCGGGAVTARCAKPSARAAALQPMASVCGASRRTTASRCLRAPTAERCATSTACGVACPMGNVSTMRCVRAAGRREQTARLTGPDDGRLLFHGCVYVQEALQARWRCSDCFDGVTTAETVTDVSAWTPLAAGADAAPTDAVAMRARLSESDGAVQVLLRVPASRDGRGHMGWVRADQLAATHPALLLQVRARSHRPRP